MSRRRVLWIVAFAAWLLLACINSSEPGTLPAAEPAPQFGIRRDGKTVTLQDLQGDVVIVNFWSST